MTERPSWSSKDAKLWRSVYGVASTRPAAFAAALKVRRLHDLYASFVHGLPSSPGNKRSPSAVASLASLHFARSVARGGSMAELLRVDVRGVIDGIKAQTPAFQPAY